MILIHWEPFFFLNLDIKQISELVCYIITVGPDAGSLIDI